MDVTLTSRFPASCEVFCEECDHPDLLALYLDSRDPAERDLVTTACRDEAHKPGDRVARLEPDLERNRSRRP